MAEEVRAVAKYIRMSPTKVRRVMGLIRGKNVPEVMNILKFTPNRAAEELTKVVKSAAANHADRFGTDMTELRVTRCWADPGPTLKRIHPRAMGRAYRILKRTSHITIWVGEVEVATTRTRRSATTQRPRAAAGHDHSHDHDHAGHNH